MDNCFVKKYWKEEGILFYIHFQDGVAIKQLEVSSQEKVYLTLDSPILGDHTLCDQRLNSLTLSDSDYISEKEFQEVWDRYD